MSFERGYTTLCGAVQLFVEKQDDHWSVKLYDRELGKPVGTAEELEEDAAKQLALRQAKNYLLERGLSAPGEEVVWTTYR